MFGLFLLILVIIYLAYLFRSTCITYRVNKNKLEKMRLAPFLNKDVKPGDYIQFKGTLNLPETETPYNKTKCVYWGAVVKAHFYTKAKSPHKGNQLHSPTLIKKSNDHLPLTISDGNQVLQLGFTNNIAAIFDLNYSQKYFALPPCSATKKLADPRYESYVVEETWAENKDIISVWGVVEDINKNCTTINSSQEKQSDFVAVHGDTAEFFKPIEFIVRNAFSLLCSLAIIFSVLLAVFIVDSQIISSYSGYIMLFFMVSVFVIILFQVRLSSGY